MHIHIYEVVGKAEIDLKNLEPQEALRAVLSLAKAGNLKFGKADCRFIAQAYPDDVITGESIKPLQIGGLAKTPAEPAADHPDDDLASIDEMENENLQDGQHKDDGQDSTIS